MVSLSEILYFDYKLDNIISPYMQLSKKTGNEIVPSLFLILVSFICSGDLLVHRQCVSIVCSIGVGNPGWHSDAGCIRDCANSG